ncbi:MAG: calcium/sodium antiporter [Ignavibacteria bacterium]
MLVSFILLFAGFMLLIKGADFLVEGSSSLAYRMKIPQIVIGLTIVAFGTSTPELIVNVFSAIEGMNDVGFGNVVGSNIINIFLILGIAALISPLQTQKNTVWKEIPFALLGALVLLVMCNDFLLSGAPGFISTSEGIILLFFFAIFIVYIFGIAEVKSENTIELKQFSNYKILVFILLGLAGLIIGGNLVVDNAVSIAADLGVSDRVIGLTIVALGTSLPELFTSAVAAMKGKADIAVGNVVGSNIFNIFFVLAITAIINPVPFKPAMNVDLIVMSIASFLLFITMFTGVKRKIDRWEAVVFLIIYCSYSVWLFES